LVFENNAEFIFLSLSLLAIFSEHCHKQTITFILFLLFVVASLFWKKLFAVPLASDGANPQKSGRMGTTCLKGRRIE
jgi:hypothetical protein